VGKIRWRLGLFFPFPLKTFFKDYYQEEVKVPKEGLNRFGWD